MKTAFGKTLNRRVVERKSHSRKLHVEPLERRLVLSTLIEMGAEYSDLVVFGDSTSDVGNLHNMTLGLAGGPYPMSPPYYGGRSANGLVWNEYLAEQLELHQVGFYIEPQASDANNFAVYGAATGRENYTDQRFPGEDFPGIRDQVDAYLFTTSGVADPEALYVVWAGPNDFLLLNPTAGPMEIQEAVVNGVTNIATAIGMLQYAGAQQVLVPNMPDLGATPLGQSGLLGVPAEQLTMLTEAFNGALWPVIQNNPGVIPFNVSVLFDSMISDPESYGISNVTEPCLTESGICSNPDDYLFWDVFHPTTKAHELLGDAAGWELVATPPTGIVTGPDTAVPGQTVIFEVRAEDAAPADVAAGFQYAIDWNGDGSNVEIVSGPAAGVSVSHVYEMTGFKSVAVTATDQDGVVSVPQSHAINVAHVAVIDGDLYAGGTSGNDWISFVSARRNAVSVWFNGSFYGPYSLDPDAELVAFGLNGNDIMQALLVRRSVEIHGGDGRDRIYGSSGADRLFGDNGDDIIFGMAGDDFLVGGNGRDFIYGGSGHDILYGGQGNDWLFGGAGDDELDGEDGFDWLFGGWGLDLFYNGERIFD